MDNLWQFRCVWFLMKDGKIRGRGSNFPNIVFWADRKSAMKVAEEEGAEVNMARVYFESSTNDLEYVDVDALRENLESARNSLRIKDRYIKDLEEDIKELRDQLLQQSTQSSIIAQYAKQKMLDWAEGRTINSCIDTDSQEVKKWATVFVALLKEERSSHE